ERLLLVQPVVGRGAHWPERGAIRMREVEPFGDPHRSMPGGALNREAPGGAIEPSAGLFHRPGPLPGLFRAEPYSIGSLAIPEAVAANLVLRMAEADPERRFGLQRERTLPLEGELQRLVDRDGCGLLGGHLGSLTPCRIDPGV